jgi:hypothetical protein
VPLEHLKPKVLTADTKGFIDVVNKKKGKPPPAWEPTTNLIGLVVGSHEGVEGHETRGRTTEQAQVPQVKERAKDF